MKGNVYTISTFSSLLSECKRSTILADVALNYFNLTKTEFLIDSSTCSGLEFAGSEESGN